MMRIIAQQRYVKIHRTVSISGQYNQEEIRRLSLYEEKIMSKYREFPLAHVMDLSYRPVAKEGGILYIHTTKGVFSYQVTESPTNFIDACQIALQKHRAHQQHEADQRPSSLIQNVFANIRNWMKRKDEE